MKTLMLAGAGLCLMLTPSARAQDAPLDSVQAGKVVSVNEVRAEMVVGSERYRRVLDRASMSAGVYILAAESTDRQRPHERDEIYYVLAGAGKLMVAGDTLTAEPGMALFVPAKANHRFIEIEEQLELFVFFGGKK